MMRSKWLEKVAAKKRPIKRRLQKQRQPDGIRLAYFQALRKFVIRAKALVDRVLVPKLAAMVDEHDRLVTKSDARQDAGPKGLGPAIRGMSMELTKAMSTKELNALARRFAMATSEFQREELGRQLQAQTGVQISLIDAKLGPTVDQFTKENVELIKSIPQRYFEQIEEKVISGVEEGLRWEEIADDLEERYGVSEATAQLIARDQIGKLNGALNQVRQEELGIERFIWRTMNDNRVREEHFHLNGKSFDWSAPPNEETGEPDPDEGVIPGEPVQCRCFADPDVDSALKSIDEAPAKEDEE